MLNQVGDLRSPFLFHRALIPITSNHPIFEKKKKKKRKLILRMMILKDDNKRVALSIHR